MDEPLPGERAAAMAHAAAGAVRRLNHAAAGKHGIGLPPAAYDVPGSLSLAASRLGPALAEVARYPGRALAGETLGHDLGDDPRPAAGAASAFPGDARQQAAALAGDPGAAQRQIASLHPTAPFSKDQQ